VANDENADPRDRADAKWLTETQKVVFSSTLTRPPQERTRLVNAPAAEVIGELKASGSGDILINSSASIIRPLLAADMIERLYLMICPEIAGGGQRIFEDGLPASQWALTHFEAGTQGEIAMVYDRER